ncbi:acyl-CoA thioesterase [Magnetospira sp. QH-2]|uniref:acyl-CoA thioesterase n=1 Tax=Magnetospira sp. (strain QH-2) TaxID=1288970 RepID=UPI0003E813F6|nr:acyl-CoA thioesterase [Magnetospira sp. QH-2]CCQ73720.1 Acyl-CoA thioester hydrolase [Magnetospira sp. QH-2]
MTDQTEPGPHGIAATRTLAMPADTNPNGDIFGGWLMAQMDVAGSLIARERAGGRVATVAVDAMAFHLPVRVGDVVSCHGLVQREGTTSLSVHVEAWVQRHLSGHEQMVTEGTFVYVAIDGNGAKRKLPPVSGMGPL